MDILQTSKTISDVSQTVLKLSLPESQDLDISVPTLGEYLSFTVTRLTRIEEKFLAKAERKSCQLGDSDYPECKDKLRQESLEALAVRVSNLNFNPSTDGGNVPATNPLTRLELVLNQLEKIYDE
jgi:hypothetical protein